MRALNRNPDAVKERDGLDWRRGDAMSPADVTAAAEGATLIVHAVNPPGYRDWDKLVLPMLDSTIAAARASGAPILLPGTIYNYGPDAFPLLAEDSPQHPTTRKGAIRVEMEEPPARGRRDAASRRADRPRRRLLRAARGQQLVLAGPGQAGKPP